MGMSNNTAPNETGAPVVDGDAVVFDDKTLTTLRSWLYDHARPLIADECDYAQLDAWGELPAPVRVWVDTMYSRP